MEFCSDPKVPHAQRKTGSASSPEAALLSEIFAQMVHDEHIPAAVREQFPELTQEEYNSATDLMLLLLTACEWRHCFASVERNPIDPRELAETLQSYLRKLELYRRHGDDYLTGDYEALVDRERNK